MKYLVMLFGPKFNNLFEGLLQVLSSKFRKIKLFVTSVKSLVLFSEQILAYIQNVFF